MAAFGITAGYERARASHQSLAGDIHEWEFDGRERRIILCVETALELQPGCEGFDSRRLDELIQEATHIMRASASPIDSIRIVPER